MDKQLEEKIRERAYELWMQHGCLPDRSEEYWYQAEKEILGDVGSPPAGDAGSMPATGSAERSSDQEGEAPLETSSAPLGMTSQTADEAVLGGQGDLLSPPEAPKTRKRRGTASTAPGEGGDTTGETPKRRRTVRTT